MTKPLGQRLYEIKGALEAIEQELAAGSIPPEGLEDFKMVVDHPVLQRRTLDKISHPKKGGKPATAFWSLTNHPATGLATDQ